MRLAFLLVFFFFPFFSCSINKSNESVDILQLISTQISTFHRYPRIDRNYHNFLCFIHQNSHDHGSLLEALETGYHKNSLIPNESERWMSAIDYAFSLLVDEQPDLIEYILNEHLIPSHPFHSHFQSPFELTSNLKAFFTEFEYKTFNDLMKEILCDSSYSPEIYSPSHLQFLNLLFDFGDLVSWSNYDLKYHLSFLFRATFIDFNLVINRLFALTFVKQPSLLVLAESVHESLFKKDPEQARLALKFAVNVRSTDLSHLSYFACIREYSKRQLTPMLPHNLLTALTSRYTTTVNFLQSKFLKYLETVGKQDIFWLIYNEFYFDPVKFEPFGYDHFWWSLIYSLVHRFNLQFNKKKIFSGITNEQLLLELKEPIEKDAENVFLRFESKESDLFRSVLVNGHYATVLLLLEISPFTFPQNRIDWILRFVSIYSSSETFNFLFSLSAKFEFSSEALYFALSTVISHGKVSLLPKFPQSLLTDKILFKANSKGHFDIVKRLLSTGKFISEEAVIKLAKEAFESDNLDNLIQILTFSNLNLRSLPFLFKAFSKNDLKLCQFIVDSIYFNDEEVLEIVKEATYAAFTLKQPQVLLFIIEETDLFFNQKAQDLILISAISAPFPDLKLSRSIVSKFGFKFSNQIRKLSLSIALNSSNATEIVPLLLEFPLIFCKHESSLLSALLIALDRNFLFNEILKTCQNHLTPVAFNSLLQETCHQRKFPQIKNVLKASSPSTYSPPVRNWLLLFAVQEGNLNLIKFIVCCGFKFPIRTIRQATLLAQRHRNIQNYLIRVSHDILDTNK